MDPPTLTLASAPPIGVARGLIVPRLDGIPAVCGVRDDDQIRAQLALTMIDAGIAPASLLGAQPNPAKFISAAFEQWLRDHGSAQIDRRFEFMAALGTWPRYYDNRETEIYFLVLEATHAGYAPWGRAFKYLSQWDVQLPSTIWYAFQHLSGRFRGYDYLDAIELEEMLLDGMDEEDLETYRRENGLKSGEIQVKRPACLERRPLTRAQVLRRCRQWPAAVRSIAQRALELLAADKRIPDRGREEYDLLEEVNHDMGIPVPCFLSSFSLRDAVCAAFDQESQSFYEDERAPALMIPLMTLDVVGVRTAFRRFALHLEVLRCGAALLDAIPALRRYAFKSVKEESEARVIEPTVMHAPPRPVNTLWEAA